MSLQKQIESFVFTIEKATKINRGKKVAIKMHHKTAELDTNDKLQEPKLQA